MDTISKNLAQEIVMRAKVASCDIKIFLLDGNEVLNADWTARGLNVKSAVTKDELDYLKLSWFSRPHLSLSVPLSARFQQYMLIGVWGSNTTLAKLKDAYTGGKE